MLDVVRRVCGAARDAGARVVHCTAVTRADGAGAALNSRLMVLADRARREHGGAATAIGSAGAALVDGLEDERDVVVPRLHGLTPFTSTSLDQILRNLGVRTVVATGVSLNIGVLGMCLTAGDLGYQVVVVRDGVVGVPAEYGQAVLDNTLSMIATIVTSGELLAAWEATGACGSSTSTPRRTAPRATCSTRGRSVTWRLRPSGPVSTGSR
jgi:nicotinamidase-related amidase